MLTPELEASAQRFADILMSEMDAEEIAEIQTLPAGDVPPAEKSPIPFGGKLKRLSDAEADAALASFNITREQVEASLSQLDSLLGISPQPIAASGCRGMSAVSGDVAKKEPHDGK